MNRSRTWLPLKSEVKPFKIQITRGLPTQEKRNYKSKDVTLLDVADDKGGVLDSSC